jgi:NADH:ubiquinone oxidoreductase subunit E
LNFFLPAEYTSFARIILRSRYDIVGVVQEIDISLVDRIIDRSGSDPEALIGILQDIQGEFRYLPIPVLKLVAEKLGVPVNRIWAVVTFYEAFTLEPLGHYHLQVCTGTACHVRGATEIVRAIEDELMIASGHTTPDGLFSLECVHCVGACAMGPVIAVGDEFFGHLTRSKALDLIGELRSRSEDEKP